MNIIKKTISRNLPESPVSEAWLQDDMLVLKMKDGRITKIMLFPFQLAILRSAAGYE